MHLLLEKQNNISFSFDGAELTERKSCPCRGGLNPVFHACAQHRLDRTTTSDQLLQLLDRFHFYPPNVAPYLPLDRFNGFTLTASSMPFVGQKPCVVNISCTAARGDRNKFLWFLLRTKIKVRARNVDYNWNCQIVLCSRVPHPERFRHNYVSE